MNETFFIKLNKGNVHLPIIGFSPEGLSLDVGAKEDSSPYRFLFTLAGQNEATRHRLRRISELNNWPLGHLQLKAFTKDGLLGIKGLDKTGLPHGHFSLRIQLEDFIVSDKECTFHLEEDSEFVVPVRIKADPRSVKITKDFSEFDPHFRRILFENADSEVDKMEVDKWLDDPSRRPKRKACLLNLLAMLRVFPKDADALIQHINYVFVADVDRIYVSVQKSFHEALKLLAKDEESPVFSEGKPKSPIHERLLDRIPNGENYELDSFRGEGTPSFQTVVAVPPTGADYFAELDVDLGNPLQDLAGLVIHLGELATPGRTDHLALRDKKLDKDPIRELLYYRVMKKA